MNIDKDGDEGAIDLIDDTDGSFNIIEEKSAARRVRIEERERVHLMDASDSDEDVDVDVEVDSGDDGVMPMTAVDVGHAVEATGDDVAMSVADVSHVVEATGDGVPMTVADVSHAEEATGDDVGAQRNSDVCEEEGVLPTIPDETKIRQGEGFHTAMSEQAISASGGKSVEDVGTSKPSETSESTKTGLAGDELSNRPAGSMVMHLSQMSEQPSELAEQLDHSMKQTEQFAEHQTKDESHLSERLKERPSRFSEQPNQVYLDRPSVLRIIANNCSQDTPVTEVDPTVANDESTGTDESTQENRGDVQFRQYDTVMDQDTNTPVTEVDATTIKDESAETGDSTPEDGDDDDSSSSSDEEEDIPKAAKEVILDREVVTEEEKERNPSFFKEDGTTKTPEKYLLIRNKILDCW